MKVVLPTNTFSFFKVILGSSFLLIGLLFPLAAYFSVITSILSRPHGLGAYFSMWRAGKLTRTFACAIVVVSLAVTAWGLWLAPLPILALVTYLLFAFHFIYDEFVLQETDRLPQNILMAATPFALMVVYLLADFRNIMFSVSAAAIAVATMLVVELLYIKEIDWFFIQTKLLSTFVLGSIYFAIPPYAAINVLFISHYFFWFIYPVYKLHTHKREERDGMIIVLVILGLSCIYSSTTSLDGATMLASLDIFTRLFCIATLIHILTTAPFAYYMGMPRSTYGRPAPATINS